jgi:predicted RNA-binding protein with PUA-like domain
MRYWLMKTEPDAFSIDDLKRLKKDAWSGVRNYQARNFMKEMRLGDAVLFYHSSTQPPGVAGLAKVVGLAHPDETQFEKKSPYFDPKAMKEKPIWHCVDIGFVKKFLRLIPLEELRGINSLNEMVLLQRGSRLSVQPVTKKEYDAIINLQHL